MRESKRELREMLVGTLPSREVSNIRQHTMETALSIDKGVRGA